VRGADQQTGHLFSYISPEQRVPTDHPLRPIREMVDAALRGLSPTFEVMYSWTGRPSIPPEQVLRALLLQVLFSIRSERDADGTRGLLSDDHSTVDGTLLDAWASFKSFKPHDGKRDQAPPDDPGDGHGNRAPTVFQLRRTPEV
jgi:Transposase domain (DUF772)